MKKYTYILLAMFLLFGLSSNEMMGQRMNHKSSRSGTKVGDNTKSRSANDGAISKNKRPKTKNINTNRNSSRRPSTQPNYNIRSNNRKIVRKSTKVKIKVNKRVRINPGHHHRHYNGHRGYQPYRYHPYRGHRYGPHWHPHGHILRTLATAAIITSINNKQYHYYSGVYYVRQSGGYMVVNPPINIIVNTLPDGFENIMLNGYSYAYFGGAFYVKENGQHKVIDAPDGAVVTYIPEGATEEDINGNYYVVYNHTYYQPFYQNGKNLYQVVDMNPYN